jgi:hypothetical protein
MSLNVMFVLALALAPNAAYNRGNALYAQRDYAHAAAAYEQALAAGPNASVHYNLANALFKSGQIGRAILHYRRARFLAPRDADVRANLAFARSYRVDKVLTAQGPVATALDAAFHWLSRREAALATAALFTLGALALAAWIVRRWVVALAASLLLGLLALYGFASEQAWAREVGGRPAVVAVPEASAWSGPSDEFKPILTLHDGTEVQIRETRGGYALVQLPGGTGGWIRTSAILGVY